MWTPRATAKEPRGFVPSMNVTGITSTFTFTSSSHFSPLEIPQNLRTTSMWISSVQKIRAPFSHSIRKTILVSAPQVRQLGIRSTTFPFIETRNSSSFRAWSQTAHCDAIVHRSQLLEFERDTEAVTMGVEDLELVQSLADLRIDPAFVLDPEHRPHRKHNDYSLSGGHVPVVDLAPLREHPSEAEIKAIVAEIGQACEDWGFFQVVNHGVSLALLEDLEAAAKQFFDLPLEEKRKVRRTRDNALGYYDSELTKNRRDWKEVFDFKPSGDFELRADDESLPKPHNQWPYTPPALREVCENWSRAVERLALELMGLIAQSLGLPATHFHEHWEKNLSAIRLNYYPKCPHPDVVLGVSRHKDPGALTVLVQDEVGGLEVRRKDGEWVGVQPRRDAFVINVGDVFQVWSNDRYRSIEHRVVVNENKERFSFPLFFNPSSETDVAPAPEILGQDLPQYRPYNFGHFLAHRNTSNFKVLGEDNIQISDFAINRD